MRAEAAKPAFGVCPSCGYEPAKPASPKIPRSQSSMERLELERQEQAAYHDHGRHHFASEKLAVIEQDDPFKFVFEAFDMLQECAVPLILGAVVAMVMAICRVFQGGVWKSRMAFWQNFPPKYATKAVMNQGTNKYAPVSDTEKPKLPCM